MSRYFRKINNREMLNKMASVSQQKHQNQKNKKRKRTLSRN